MKRCPKCQLINPETAQVCDCGWRPDPTRPGEPQEWVETQQQPPRDTRLRRSISVAACVTFLCCADAAYYRTFREYLEGLTAGRVGSCTRSNLNLWCFCLVVLVPASLHVVNTQLPPDGSFTRKSLLIAGALGLGLIGVHMALTLF